MEDQNKEYNFEEEMTKQETNTIASDAVALAKENIRKKKLECEAEEVQFRMENAERKVNKAVQDARFASKRKNILKKYSEDIAAAKAKFESTGNYREYDKTVREIENTRTKRENDAKTEVYGDDAWRY